jgi:hypothetical protein
MLRLDSKEWVSWTFFWDSYVKLSFSFESLI